MTSTTTLLFVVLTASVCYLSSVHGKPSAGDINPTEEPTSNATLTRNRRQYADGAGVALQAGQLIADGVNRALDSPSCTRAGCHNGYCWAYCHGALGREREWCYTTRGKSQDYNYIKCGSDGDCNGCWKCAGSCTIGF